MNRASRMVQEIRNEALQDALWELWVASSKKAMCLLDDLTGKYVAMLLREKLIVIGGIPQRYDGDPTFSRVYVTRKGQEAITKSFDRRYSQYALDYQADVIRQTGDKVN